MEGTGDSAGVELLREAQEQSLREREITFSTLARIAPVGIVRFDARGRCNYVNERWRAMTGMTIDEAIGDGWMEAIHPEDRTAVAERWQAMRHEDEFFRDEYRLCPRDGRVKWVLAEGAALRGYAGEPLGYIRTVTDITSHREMEMELEESRAVLEQRVRQRTAALEAEMLERQKLEKQVLEARDQEQKRFSLDLHDGLGQYLIGIQFRVSALQRELANVKSPLETHAAEIAILVNEASRQTHDLVRGVNPVPPRPDGLVLAVQELVEQLRSTEAARFAFECEEPVHVEDNAVATHLYRIAQEGLTNAMKHSGAKRITVRLQKDGSDAALLIADDGRGLPLGDSGRSGRGLNIMKHRAGLIDARLSVDSVPDGGTTVRCTFQPNRRQLP